MTEPPFFHVRTAFMMLAILGVLQAFGSSIALRANSRQPLSQSQRLWVGSSLAAAAMGLVIGTRGSPASLASLLCSHTLMMSWLAFAWSALRLERGYRVGVGAVALAMAASLVLYASCVQTLGEAKATAYPALVAMAGALAVGWQARALARSEGSDGAWLTAMAFGFTALVVLVRAVDVVLSQTPVTSVSQGGASQVLVAVGGISIFLLGNLGYLGLQIERLTRQRLVAEVSRARVEERHVQSQERVQALQVLLEERDMLIQRLQRLDAVQQQALLAAALPHELRQPLGAMRLNLDALVRQLGGEGRVPTELLQALDTDTQRLSGMVDGFMARISESAANEPAELMDVLDVVTVVDAALAVTRPRAAASGIELTLLAPGQHPARTCPAMLHQVVLILVTNALDAVSGRTLPGRVQVRITQVDAEIQVRISDNGAGIAPHVWPHLFEPFSSGKVDGVGIGLALAQRLAKRCAAEVSAQEAHDDADFPGACFVIRLANGLTPHSPLG